MNTIKLSEWIPIHEKKPDTDGRYLVCENHIYEWIGIAAMRNGKFDMEITHWMDLPEKPNATNTREEPLIKTKADEGN